MRKLILQLCLLAAVLQLHAQEQFITTSDSVKLYVHVKGSGPACLYLHGGPGSGSYWLEQFAGAELERHFTMVYLDQRGVGRSGSPADGNYSAGRMVQDFEEVRQALGFTHWLTLGHSFGGLLQMSYVTRCPEAISGMIFINCTLSMDDSFGNSWLPKAFELAGEDVPAVCRDTTVSLYNRMLAIMPVLGKKDSLWKIFFSQKENVQKMNETYYAFETWNNDQSEKILELPDYWTDFRPLTSAVNQPVLFFYGKTDWAIGPEHYKGMLFPNMQLWGSDVGHMPFLENKADLVNAIESFCAQNKFW